MWLTDHIYYPNRLSTSDGAVQQQRLAGAHLSSTYQRGNTHGCVHRLNYLPPEPRHGSVGDPFRPPPPVRPTYPPSVYRRPPCIEYKACRELLAPRHGRHQCYTSVTNNSTGESHQLQCHYRRIALTRVLLTVDSSPLLRPIVDDVQQAGNPRQLHENDATHAPNTRFSRTPVHLPTIPTTYGRGIRRE